jgi:phosphoenolpyruvate-protein kinase (PTS system EI component)
MKTFEISSYGYNCRFAKVILQSKIGSLSPEGNWSGKCLVIQQLPSIDEFNKIVEKLSECEFILLPSFSPYSHFAANIWNCKIPVLTAKESDYSFTGSETLLVDFNSEKMYLAESANDIDDLRKKYLTTEKASEIHFRNQIQDSPLEILGEATSLDEIDFSFSMGASGIGVLKAELFYSNNLFNYTKINQIKEYLKTSKKSFPLLIRFFDYEIKLTGIHSWSQPTKYLGYRGVRILEVEKFWLEKFMQLLDAFETDNIIPILPMITTASEVMEFKKVISSKYKGIGVTVETPAAALAINEIAALSSFVEIGLNDLTQYTMAWDRDIPNESRLPVNQIQTSVAMLIEKVVQSCNARNISYALGLDLKPSKSLAVNLNQIGVNKISCSPYLIDKWIKSFQQIHT